MNDDYLKKVLCDICADISPDEAKAQMLLQMILERLRLMKKRE